MNRHQGMHAPIPCLKGTRLNGCLPWLQALALGADAVCVGRPILHGLAVNGQQGVQDVIKMMRRDFEHAMRLSGCPSLKSITPEKLLKQGEPLSRL